MALGPCRGALPLAALRRSRLAWRRISTNSTRGEEQRSPASAYQVLGLPEGCSAESVRAAFRALAKATHPDLQTHTSTADFVRILAAYEILSDSTKRAEYDKFLRSKERPREQEKDTHQRERTSSYADENADFGWRSGYSGQKDGSEVVSWLRSYRAMMRDLVNRREIGEGTGWEEVLKGEVQSALKLAYFGPRVKDQEGMPECFEAEERAHPDVEDVLQLVSGRQLFGTVRQVRSPIFEGQIRDTTVMLEGGALDVRDGQRDALPLHNDESVLASARGTSDSSDNVHSIRVDHRGGAGVHDGGIERRSPFVDLELHLFGNVVARAIRVPVKADRTSEPRASEGTDEQDCIYVYLSSERVEFPEEATKMTGAHSTTLLGTVRGLSSEGMQSVCFAHTPHGKRTHLILQHSTPMVKHIQWFRVGDERAACECRCRRATAIPSRYWIFEPRLDTHNVGGWYIETFHQDSRRHRAGNVRRHSSEQHRFKRRDSAGVLEAQAGSRSDLLHPAMYIMAAAYRTLDEEERSARRKEASLPNQITKWADHALSRSAFGRWWRNKWRSLDISNSWSK